MRRWWRTAALALLMLGLMAPASAAEDWPGWRGDGSGISPEKRLPVRWGPSKNIVWKASLAGEGISSPIVHGERVFLTEAVDRPGTHASPRRAVLLGGVAALLALLALVWSRFPRSVRRDQIRSLRRVSQLVLGVDLVLTLVALTLFLVGLGLLGLREEFVAPGSELPAWRWSAGVAFFATIAATGLIQPGSVVRLLGVVVLLPCAVLLTWHVRQHPLELLLLTGPIAAILWWCWLLRRSRRSTAPLPTLRRPVLRHLAALGLLAAAGWQLAVFNLWQLRGAWIGRVVCLHRETGQRVWSRDVIRVPAPRKHRYNSQATPTPITDGTHVVADFGSEMVCLDASGTVRWRRSQPRYDELSVYGSGTSLVRHGDLVIHAFFPEAGNPRRNWQHRRHSRLTALRIESGEVVWQTVPPDGRDSYNTPLLRMRDGVSELLVATWGQLLWYDPGSGALRHAWPIPMYQCVPSLVADPSTVYMTSGRVYGTKGTMAVRTALDAEEGTAVLWTQRRHVARLSSPVLYDGLLYLVTTKGLATCREARTGALVWKKKFAGNHHGSIVAGDGKIYFGSIKGSTTVVKAGRTGEVLAVNSIGEPARGSIAIAGGRLFIRGERHLFCIGK